MVLVTETHLFVATSRADLLVYLCCPTRRGGAHGYTAAQPKGDLTEGDILRSDRRVLKFKNAQESDPRRYAHTDRGLLHYQTHYSCCPKRHTHFVFAGKLAGYKDTPPLRPPCDRPVFLYRGTSRTAAARRARCTMPMGGIEHEACDAASSAMV